MTEEEIETGFYEFKNRTKNPQSGRGKSGYAYSTFFPEGYQVCIKRCKYFGEAGYELIFRDCSSLKFSIKDSNVVYGFKDLLPLLDHLKKIEPTYDQLLRSCSHYSILESLIAMGKISRADIIESVRCILKTGEID